MTSAEASADLRPLLFSIAYRILGSVSEAEDAVQETWPAAAASARKKPSGANARSMPMSVRVRAGRGR